MKERVPCTLPLSLTHSLPLSPTHSLTHSLTHLPTPSPTHSLSSLTHPLSSLSSQVGWQLGAILYEINALPWKYEPASTGSPSQSQDSTEGSASPLGQHDQHTVAVLCTVLLSMVGGAVLTLLALILKSRNINIIFNPEGCSAGVWPKVTRIKLN